MSETRQDATTSPYLRKLDPRLALAVRRSYDKVDPAVKAEAARAPSFRAAEEPAHSLSEGPVGLHGLLAQTSPAAAARLIDDDQISALIETEDPEELVRGCEDAGGRARHLPGTHTVSVHVPRARVVDLASLDAVRYVEASTRLRPTVNQAHGSASLVVADTGELRVEQTGKGVLIGIVDSGIDAGHPAFKADGTTRIVEYWDQPGDRHFDAAAIDAGDAGDAPDVDGHGTHVAGIAAGNGAGSPDQIFRGVAPEADLAIVKTTFDTADIAAGVAHVFDLASQRDQPCVVNLSLGGHFGGHDGSSVIERTIDHLSGPGRLVVAAAGNEGGSQIHASTELEPGGDTAARWVADFRLEARQVNTFFGGVLVLQVWAQREDALRVTVRTPTGELFQAPIEGVEEFDRGNLFVEAGHQVSPYSGDSVSTFQVVTLPSPELLSGWSLIVEEDMDAGGVQVGAVHSWILDDGMGGFTDGSTQSHLVGMPATAYSVVTVASYATRKSWRSIDPTNRDVVLDAVNLEDISHFSSPGPTRDGGNKPEVAAPGQWLISTLSSATPTSVLPSWLRIDGADYVALQGTSMAAPYTTGALALLLEKDAGIDWAEAKRRIIKSTRQDLQTRPCWNRRWGFGKLDVERLLTVEPD